MYLFQLNPDRTLTGKEGQWGSLYDTGLSLVERNIVEGGEEAENEPRSVRDEASQISKEICSHPHCFFSKEICSYYYCRLSSLSI